ncbi:hypothetical protein LEP1GSC061_0976 [Leptospira wolffii serovar Khorat str. Khorat-H2]|nr:hypothetical protein LEP1GSC061_0976 [Leptospira wolffii serovar Khorat str. Khorat-H2]
MSGGAILFFSIFLPLVETIFRLEGSHFLIAFQFFEEVS